MTPDEAAFLASIHATPSDPLPRLMFADWLSDRHRERDSLMQRILAEPQVDAHRLAWADVVESEGNGERAEFVRVQCELATLPIPSDHPHGGQPWGRGQMGQMVRDPARPEPFNLKVCDCRLCTLRKREAELLSGRVGWVWEGEAVAHAVQGYTATAANGRTTRGFEFARGFVSALTLPAAAWLTHATAIRDAQPVERVELLTWPGLETQWHPDVMSCRMRVPGMMWRTVRECLDIPGGPYKGADHRCLAAEFPGIAFELPRAQNPDAIRRVADWRRRAGV